MSPPIDFWIRSRTFAISAFWCAAGRTAHRKSLREWLSAFDGWPRDGRAWARRGRIKALLSTIDTAMAAASQQKDIERLLKLITELDEWVRRERAFLRDYPIIDPPLHWARREVSPSARRKSRRAWRRPVPRDSDRHAPAPRLMPLAPALNLETVGSSRPLGSPQAAHGKRLESATTRPTMGVCMTLSRPDG